MSDEPEGIHRDAKGNVTIFAPPATLVGSARTPGGASAKPPAEEPISAELTRVIRHLNGLAVAVESLRLKVLERERAGSLRIVPKE